jgi:hypothetical protein
LSIAASVSALVAIASTPTHSMPGANCFQNASTRVSSSDFFSGHEVSFVADTGAARKRWTLYGLSSASSASVLSLR